jgi:hypothetical protein
VKTSYLLFPLLYGFFVFLSMEAQAGTPLPLTDNQSPPYLAVQGAPMDLYGKWLNRTRLWLDRCDSGLPMQPKTWAALEAYNSVPDASVSATMKALPSSRLILAWPILPSDGSTLAQGATGAYNAHFAVAAKALVDKGLAGQTIICFGSDFTYATPKVNSSADAALFVKYWQQIVTAVKAVPGADKLQFAWVGCAGKTNFAIEEAYPGDAFVDYVGSTVSEGCGDRSIYPYPFFISESEKRLRQEECWQKYAYPASDNGLEAWCALAKAHHKPFCIPSWSLNGDHTQSEAGDAPVFIQHMHDFIQDPDNNVYFHSYWEYYHCSQLCPDGKDGCIYLQSSDLFHQLFALPAKP